MFKRVLEKMGVCSKQGGFSMIEVMVSSALLLIGVSAIATGEIQSFAVNRRSSEMVRAISAAEDILEMIRRHPTRATDYALFNTSNASSTPLTMAQDDFNRWKSSVEAIGQLYNEERTCETVGKEEVCKDPDKEFFCGAVKVTTACGVVQVAAVSSTDLAQSVTITIVWPSRQRGITIQTTIES